MEELSTELLDWAAAACPLDPAQESGDAFLVRPLAHATLAAVVDGLGHGPPAAAAARRATALLAEADHEHPLATLRRCHEGLKSTRGVVLGLAWFDGGQDTMTWLGVGNVAGVLVRARADAQPRQELLLSRGGIIGRQIPPFHASVLSVAPGDTLVFATDGIQPDLPVELPPAEPPQRIADRILATLGTGADDALVLVVRYQGARR